MNEETAWLLDLLEREGRRLHGLLYRLTLDAHAAEDLMQELFLKCAAKRVRGIENPGAYLRQAAIHLALDWRRGRKREQDRVAKAPAATEQTSTAHDEAVQHEQWARILDAAAELEGMTREAFALHYVQGLPVDEVASELARSAHQVRALCHKAVEHLRELCTPIREDDSHVARK